MRRLLNWLRRRTLESDFDRELQYHVDRRVNELTQAGLPERDARLQVEREIGGTTQVREEVRDIWLTRWLRDLAYDLRFSARSFWRSPSFSATVIILLALGIGSTTAIYSLLDQVVLHALGVRDPQRLVLIDWEGEAAAINTFGSSDLMSYPICRQLGERKEFFDGVFCRAATFLSLATGTESWPAAAELVSGSYFSVLGVQPALGRLISLEDDQTPGASPVVVLSYNTWNVEFGGSPDVLGRKIWINAQPMTVVGVAEESFRGIDIGEVPAIWIPASMSAAAIPGFDNMLNRGVRWMQVLGRLQQHVTLDQAEAGLQPWFKSMLAEDARLPEFPNISPEKRRAYDASSLELTPAPQGHSGLRQRLSQPLWVLFAATAMLLGLACLNVAGLFLARGSARARELGTRLAIGASRSRVGRQLLADNILLSLIGGVLGVLLAPLVMRALIAFLPQGIAANALHAVIDIRLLLAAFVISVLTGLLAGLAPAVHAGRGSLSRSLRDRAATSSDGLRLRRTIVTAQIALTLVLVVGASLLVKTLAGLLAKGPGFDTTGLMSFGVDPLRNGYSRLEAIRLVQTIQDELQAAPGVRSAARVVNQLLTGGSWNNLMTIQASQTIATDRVVRFNAVTPNFFSTLGAKIVAGRNFDERDTLPASDGGARVAIVNQAFVQRYLPGRNPLGILICTDIGPDAKPDTEIIGVMEDISYRGVREDWEQAYFPLVREEDLASSFYVRVEGPPESAMQSVRTIIRSVDSTLLISPIRTVDEQVNRSLSTERMLATLSGGFGSLALLMSLVGLYGVMSFVVAKRRQEIGVRMALGATRISAVWMVVRDALLMTGVGIGIALPCILVLGRLIESQLYDVQPTDPATVTAAALMLVVTNLAAALIPARRASAVNPTEALRFD